MEYQRVGKTGLKISKIGLGGWLTIGKAVEDDEAQNIVETAIEKGVNFIDLADCYGTGDAERVTGEIIEDYERRHLVISSKVYYPMSEKPNDRGLSRKHIMESIDGTLDRLGSDYLDIYYCHRYDEETPLLETMRAMNDLVEQGKVHYWGTSMWSAAQIQRAHDLADKHDLHPPYVEQPRYNLCDRSIEDEVMPTANDLGVGITPFSPLGGGLLTGKYNDGIPEGSRADQFPEWLDEEMIETNIERVREFTELAEARDAAPSQLALAWLLTKDAISSVITGASRVEHLNQNLGALDIDVDEELEADIDELFS